MRFNLYVAVSYLDKVLSGEIKRENSPYLRINGIKIVHGNSLSGKTCWLYEPYDTLNPATGRKDYYGIPPARSQSSLDSLVLKIHRAGLQIACHSNGDREIDMVITAIEHAQKAYPLPDRRHRIEHCSITNQSILERIKADSIIPVFHCYINELGDQLLTYGPQHWSMLIPTHSALEMGIPFALHSDYPVSRYESMTRLASAVNRETAGGFVIGPNQKIGVEDAIRAYTVGGAYTSHEEKLKGKILAGQYADMMVLDRDPTAGDPESIRSIQVTMTIVGGQIAYEKK
jgi:predicted amidohydrolase YtcJ